MQKLTGYWGNVEAQMYVLDGNGTTWRVDYIDDDKATLISIANRTVVIRRPPADRPVTIFRPTEGEAKRTLAKALGAEVLAVYDTPT